MTCRPPQQPTRNPLIRLWRGLTYCPFRLFTLAALIHTGLLFLLVIGDLLPYTRQTAKGVLFMAFYGLLSTPVLGALLYWLPQRVGQSLNRGWYSVSGLLVLLALGMLETGLLLDEGVFITGGSLVLLLAWLMVKHSVADCSIHATGIERRWLVLLNSGLYLPVGGIAAFAIGLATDSVTLSGTLPSILFVVGAMMLLLAVIRLHAIEPTSRRTSVDDWLPADNQG